MEASAAAHQPQPDLLALRARRREASRWRLAAMLPVCGAFVWLMFVLPYAAGYGYHRRTLFDWLCNFWREAAWQHGALAFPIAGFLVWRQRRNLAQIPVVPSATGFVLAVFGLTLYWAGYRGSFFLVGFASMQVLMGGVLLWMLGWRQMQALFFAWFIVGFAWPYFFLEDTLAFQLRYLMVHSSSWVLNHAGIATVQDGTRMLSAAVQGRSLGQWFDLNVDAPCSGLRSLFALTMVSALYGYFRQRSTWRRALLFLLSVPLAIAANMVRIIVLIFSAILFGQNFAIGTAGTYTSNYHLLTGVFVFLVAFAGLVLAEKILNRCCGREKPLPLMEEES